MLSKEQLEFLQGAADGKLDIVQKLRDKIGNDSTDDEGHSALLLAALGGHTDVMKFLLDSG